MLRAAQVFLPLGAATVLLGVAPRMSQQMNDVLTYGVWGLALFAGGVAALLRARLAEEGMKLRWLLLGVSLCGGALAYLIASANNFASVMHVLDPLMIAAGSAGAAAMMLSITVSFAGASVSLIVLDLLQTALFIALSYVVHAGSNPWAKSVQSHVIISLLLAMMTFLTAAVAPLSATTREERGYFKLAATYLGAAWIARFISSQVGYLWMHASGNLYDLPSVGVCLAMALFLMETTYRAKYAPAPDSVFAQHRLLLRNLMPSLLALVSLMIALYVFLHAYLAGFAAVLCAIALYLSRTLLLQTHMSRESAALRQRNEQLEEISHRDALTGAGNRRSLTARYERCLSESEASVALLLVDLDFFKQANDLLGHLHGDRILTSVATVLRSVCASVAGSHVARFGGDEFALLLPQLERVEAAGLGEAVRAGVATLTLDAGERAISVSIGGAMSEEAESLTDLIRRADIALYRAKFRGRDRVEFELEEAAPVDDSAELSLVTVA